MVPVIEKLKRVYFSGKAYTSYRENYVIHSCGNEKTHFPMPLGLNKLLTKLKMLTDSIMTVR